MTGKRSEGEKNITESSLTHKDLSALLGVSETTIKSYRRKFPDCIPVANKGKPIRFTPEAGKVCLRIRDLFDTGMSVQEVRSRLAEEFAWIKKENKTLSDKRGAGSKDGDTAVFTAGALPAALVDTVNKLASSMLKLHVQQDKMQKSLNNIENILVRLGFETGETAELAGRASLLEKQSRERLDRVKNSFDRLNALADGLNKVSERLFSSLGDAEAIQRNWAAGAIAMENQLKYSLGEKADAHGQNDASERNENFDRNDASVYAGADGAVHEAQGAQGEALREGREDKVISIRDHKPREAQNSLSARAAGGLSGMSGSGGSAGVVDIAGENPQPSPPRHLMNLPLVVRQPEGGYRSADGSRDKFSLNDLKAKLALAFQPPYSFTLTWRLGREGWWFDLEQKNKESESTSFSVLVTEISSSKGARVLEARQVLANNELIHPAEFSNFIMNI